MNIKSFFPSRLLLLIPNHRNKWSLELLLPTSKTRPFGFPPNPMASTTAPHASHFLLRKAQNGGQLREQYHRLAIKGARSTRRNHDNSLRVFASQDPTPQKGPSAPPGVDTRIHWDNEDEGWIGGSTTSQPKQQQHQSNEPKETKNLLGEKFSDLLNDSSDSHYQ
jgi:hypothetical protein